MYVIDIVCTISVIFETRCICVTDMLHALSEEQISWVQRVKLARYAWVSEDVLLPNKRQILMNILVNAVSASRR